MSEKSTTTDTSTPPAVRTIGLDGIAVPPDRLRKLRPEVVEQLAQSIDDRGELIEPVAVRPRGAIGYLLVAGHHRLEAMRKLGREHIRAVVLEGLDDDAAQLVEIDENLCRADLTPAERAMHVARRKELYEAKHPETKRGAAPGAGRGKGKATRLDKSQNESFVKDTAVKTGKGRSTVARDVTRANKVVVLADIAGTLLDRGDEIDALAQLPEPEQRKLAERANAGERVSARTKLKQVARQERE
jgi:ParB-like chromosome segregation protein Spo0J